MFWLPAGASARYMVYNSPSLHAWIEARVVYPARHCCDSNSITPGQPSAVLCSEMNCCALADGTYNRGLITTARQCTCVSRRVVESQTPLHRILGTRKALLEPEPQCGGQPPAQQVDARHICETGRTTRQRSRSQMKSAAALSCEQLVHN